MADETPPKGRPAIISAVWWPILVGLGIVFANILLPAIRPYFAYALIGLVAALIILRLAVRFVPSSETERLLLSHAHGAVRGILVGIVSILAIAIALAILFLVVACIGDITGWYRLENYMSDG